EPWGKVHFFLTFVAANCTFFPMHILGVGLHMRRISDPTIYPWLEPYMPLNQFISISALVLGASQLIFVGNFVYSLIWGPKAARTPWHSNTLEWTAPSPPPHGNFATMPIVYRGPYEYGVDGVDHDYLPQTDTSPLARQLVIH